MPPRKGAKKPKVAEENTQEVDVPVKGKRGKATAPADAEVKKPSGRGRKKAEEPAASSPVEEAKPAKKGRGRKAAEEHASPAKKAKDEDNANDAGPSTPAKSPKKKASPTKTKAGAKKRGAAAKAAPKSPVANGSGEKVAGKRGRKAKQVPTPDVDEDEEVADEVQPEPPKAKGRGKRAAPVDEAPDSTTSPSSAKKGKKAAKSSEDAPADGAKVAKKRGGRKAATGQNGESSSRRKRSKDDENDAVEPKPVVVKKARANATSTDYSQIDFRHEKSFKLKIASWNVSGMRAWIAKGGLEYVEHENPDIFCLQEIKCKTDDMPSEGRVQGYLHYWLCHGGYAGVAIYTKRMPMHVTYGIGDTELDEDGRVITAEFEKFYLVSVYVPNAGRGLVTLPKRLRFDEKFHAFVSKLDQNKPVIICGDMNVAHEEIDLANPKTNKRNAGFTQEERDSMTKFFCLGFVDTFRHLYPKQAKAYTFWTYMMNARGKNVGWRLDYFIVSQRLVSSVVDSIIRSPVMGSDHCPIVGLFNI
ncbi:recombination repair protein 1 [Sergentomyia squamirostris]